MTSRDSNELKERKSTNRINTRIEKVNHEMRGGALPGYE
jgi:hypothetical protein